MLTTRVLFRYLGLTCAVFGAFAPAIADVSGGYICLSPNELDYLTVTETDHKLTGYVQVVSKNLEANGGFTAVKLDFQGEISNGSYTLHVYPNGAFGGADWSGKFNSAGSTLYIPAANGQTSTLQLKRSSTDVWNRTVASFEKTCGRDALHQTWLISIRNHVQSLVQQTDKATQDRDALTVKLASSQEELESRKTQLSSTEERLAAAHSFRNYVRGEADKMAAVAKRAQECVSSASASLTGFIGVETVEIKDIGQLDSGNAHGATVMHVISGSPASRGGLAERDRITGIGTDKVGNGIDVSYAMLSAKPGTALQVEYVRDGSTHTTNVTIGELPSQTSEQLATWAGRLSYESGETEYVVGQAEYRIGQAEFNEQAAKTKFDQAQEQVESLQTELDSAKDTIRRNTQELDVLKAGKPYFARLAKGALWNAVTTTNGRILAGPFEDSANTFSLQASQGLSVVPVNDDWCLVALQNKGVGWINRKTVKISGGEPSSVK